MPREGANPNKFMFSSLLKACNLRSSPLEGKQIHLLLLIYMSMLVDYSRQVFDESSQFYVECCTTMINGYIRFGSLDEAGQLFDEMVERGIISWSAMISGYVQMGRHKDAFSLFHKMQLENKKIQAGNTCSRRLLCNLELSTSMVDMYSKCGALEMTLKLFRKIPTEDVGSWNAMISGLAMHGHGQEAIELFHEI
ncbi:hypothetical protein AMTRI_Chr06g176410 [Amborella trichopoda]